MKSLLIRFMIVFVISLLVVVALYQGRTIAKGMDKKSLYKIYPFEQARTYRKQGEDLWVSYNAKANKENHRTISFHFHQDKLAAWTFDDRREMLEGYLNEFCSLQGFSTIFEAIKDVMMRMPYEDFLIVTDRRRPVIFTEFYDSGTSRFARSMEMVMTKDDPPCCQQGFTLLKLGLGLGIATAKEPIEGVVAHELAHRVLDHIRKGYVNCDAERQANRLIKQWGFNKEYLLASQVFGQKKGDPAACQEKN